jgi:hypothetical protein
MLQHKALWFAEVDGVEALVVLRHSLRPSDDVGIYMLQPRSDLLHHVVAGGMETDKAHAQGVVAPAPL